MGFYKKKEDFKCLNCEIEVKGDGYTNHCPDCLWSRHVDNNPGDRESSCGGMMKPVEYNYEISNRWVMHECIKCGKRIKNKLKSDDNINVLIEAFKEPK